MKYPTLGKFYQIINIMSVLNQKKPLTIILKYIFKISLWKTVRKLTD